MRDDPPPLFQGEPAAKYGELNYSGLTGVVMRAGHRLMERPFGLRSRFPKVLEVGAGDGRHLPFVRHRFDEYWLTDGSEAMLGSTPPTSDPRIRKLVASARRLPFESGSFDRLIASHVLEHLAAPHEVLREWARLVRTGGVISIVIPCDPGFAWRLGRHLGPRRRAKAHGIAYDFVMAREHVNPVGNLVAFLRYYWPDLQERWWPARLASLDLNLLYSATVRIG
jgi:ubiquinone/menaquinone biosynthesis C-methylase UbiE